MPKFWNATQKKNSLWLMTFRLQYIRRKIKWVIWKYIGNASFLPNCQKGTPSFDFQPHKNFFFLCVFVCGIIQGIFSNFCQKREGETVRGWRSLRNGAEILDPLYTDTGYTLLLCSASRWTGSNITLALVLYRQNWVGFKWANVTPTSTIATVKLWSPWTGSL